MQDAIYNQIQLATNVANTPYERYELPTVAELSPLQQQAYQNVVSNQNAWRGASDAAQAGMRNMSTADTTQRLRADQSAYLTNPNLVQSDLAAGRSSFNRAGGLDAVGAAQPALNRAAGVDSVAAAQPFLNQAGNQNVVGAAQPFLTQAANQNITGAAQQYLTGAANQNITGAAQPMLNRAADTTTQSLAERSLAAANPYLTAASTNAASSVDQYMNPYQSGVLDVIAQRGARNLTENILPNVSDAFVKAGQFGSSRMGEFGSRAVRDTQEAIIDAQSQAAQQGYGQAMSAAQTDLARQAQLAGTAGSISGSDLSRIMQGGSQFANIGQTQGQLTAQQAQMLAGLGQTQGQLTAQQAQMLANLGQTQGQLTGQQAQIFANLGQTQGQLSAQQMQNLTNLGQTQGQLTAQQMAQLTNLGQAQNQSGQAQQQFGINAAQFAQQAQAGDYQRQIGALNNMSDLARQGQAMAATDVASLEAAGAAQQSQLQRELNAAYQQYEDERLYPMRQLDWLNTQVRGMAPIVPQSSTSSTSTTGGTYSPSPLAQLATGASLYRGAQNS
jgi:hypothetical protein